MKKRWYASVVVLMLVGAAFAADKGTSRVTPNLDKGTKTLEGAGEINVMGDELQIRLAYGQFVADGIELALVAGLRDSDLYMSTELGVRAEYNLARESALVPFLSAGLFWADVEADGSGIETDAAVLAVGGGLKYFIRDDVALAMDGSLLSASEEIFVDSEDGEIEEDEFRFLFSVRFYFD